MERKSEKLDLKDGVCQSVERSFAWAARFEHLARDCERLPETQAGLHFLVFAILMLKNFVRVMAYIL